MAERYMYISYTHVLEKKYELAKTCHQKVAMFVKGK